MVEHDIPIGLIVERLDPSNTWGEAIWLPRQALDGIPETPPWTVLAKGPDRIIYFAGSFAVRLYSTETEYYRSNLLSERPRLWVVMRPAVQPADTDPPVEIIAVTADPTEGEGYTETGTNIVEVIDVPPGLAAEIAVFVDEHHIDRVFEKRKRDKRPPQINERRRPMDEKS